MEQTVIAPATDEDLECVRALWAASYREVAASRGITGAHFDRWIAKRQARLLGRGHCLVAKQGDLILGWIVGECWGCGAEWGCEEHHSHQCEPRGIAHYIYVKAYARRQGLARALLNELAQAISVDPNQPWVYTHRRIPYTFGLESLGWTFRPKLAR